MSGSALPPGIDPQSGCRLPLPKREELDPEGRRDFDRLTDPKGGSLAGLWGPGGIRLHSPRGSAPTHALNRYLRHEAGFSGPIRELAILVTARAMDSQFEWAAHEPQGLKEGLPAAIVETVRLDGTLDGVPEREAAVIQIGRDIFDQRYVSPDTFARALRLFGTRKLVDLVSLMGQYVATATLLAAFDIQLHPGQTPRLPPRPPRDGRSIGAERLPPNDIDPESGSRLKLPDRDALDDATRRIFDYFADPNSGTYVGLRGPGGVRLHSPRVVAHMQDINRYLRREAGIDPRVRELAILAVARELDSQFEWTAHEPEALKAGIAPEIVDIVRNRRDLNGLDETDEAVIRLGREILGAHRLSSESYALALRLFGPRMLVDLVSVMGNYAATAALLTAFDVQLHPGWKPLLPIP